MTATEFGYEVLVKPWLVDAKIWIGKKSIAIEALNVIAFEGGAIPQMLTSSSFMAATSMVPVTARPKGVVLK